MGTKIRNDIKRRLEYSITVNEMWKEIRQEYFTVDEVVESLREVLNQNLPPLQVMTRNDKRRAQHNVNKKLNSGMSRP